MSVSRTFPSVVVTRSVTVLVNPLTVLLTAVVWVMETSDVSACDPPLVWTVTCVTSVELITDIGPAVLSVDELSVADELTEIDWVMELELLDVWVDEVTELPSLRSPSSSSGSRPYATVAIAESRIAPINASVT